MYKMYIRPYIDYADIIYHGENQESMEFQKDYLQLFKLNACSKKQVIQALIGRIQRMYGKKYMGIERSTFLIDENGVILKIWREVDPNGHAQEIIDFIESLNKT